MVTTEQSGHLQAEIVRLEQSQQGTLGVLRLDGQLFCLTLEPPDNNNAQNISSIPAGEYVCQRVNSPKYGNTFEVLDVPDRTHILFHAGNTKEDTRGCILLGQQTGTLHGKKAVLASKAAFAAFLEKMQNMESFLLHIARWH